jgi:DNA-binding NtrC family response regulator
MPPANSTTLPGRRHAAAGVPIALRLVASGREVPLPEEAADFSIGSAPANSLVLDDRYVSATHCLVARSGPTTLLVRDRRSRNGTIVNGTRVRECEVGVGARLLLGDTALVVVGSRGTRPRLAAEELVGNDPTFRGALEMAMRAASSPASILTVGESGTGKELVARLIHEASPRNQGPFVAVNCGAIAANLVESELFGHERGSFTGAVERRPGVFEQARGGTLFLDEIGELPLEQQPRLLRVLETRRFRRVGGHEELACDLRIVAATHRDLRAETARGDFRLDLYHRLSTVEIRLPPLRERPADIPTLARKFVADLAVELGPRTIREEALTALQAHPWPGNARELRNALYRAALLHGAELTIDAVLAQVSAAPASGGRTAAPEPLRAREAVAPYATVDDALRRLIAGALSEHGTVRRAAAAVGLAKSTFYDHARRLGLLEPTGRGG